MGPQPTHTFSIENVIDEVTERPFGQRYAGEFTIRRPSLHDRRNVALRESAGLYFGGVGVDPAVLPNAVVSLNYIFSHLDVIATSKPGWTDPTKLWAGDEGELSEDERALFAVWKEIDAFLKRFRTPKPQSPKAEAETAAPAAA